MTPTTPWVAPAGSAFRDAVGRSLFGPCFGERGVLTFVNGKARCHICGTAFHHLGNHVATTHNMTCDQYRAEFGLSRRVALISPRLRQSRSASARKALGPTWEARRQTHACVICGGLILAARGRGYARKTCSVECRRARQRQINESRRDTWPPRGPLTGDALEKGRRRIAQARERLVTIRAWSGMGPSPHPCVICDVVILGENKTCGRACFRELQRRNSKIAARPAKRTLPGTPFVERVCLMCERVFPTPWQTKKARTTCDDECLREYCRWKANTGNILVLWAQWRAAKAVDVEQGP